MGILDSTLRNHEMIIIKDYCRKYVNMSDIEHKTVTQKPPKGRIDVIFFILRRA